MVPGCEVRRSGEAGVPAQHHHQNHADASVAWRTRRRGSEFGRGMSLSRVQTNVASVVCGAVMFRAARVMECDCAPPPSWHGRAWCGAPRRAVRTHRQSLHAGLRLCVSISRAGAYIRLARRGVAASEAHVGGPHGVREHACILCTFASCMRGYVGVREREGHVRCDGVSHVPGSGLRGWSHLGVAWARVDTFGSVWVRTGIVAAGDTRDEISHVDSGASAGTGDLSMSRRGRHVARGWTWGLGHGVDMGYGHNGGVAQARKSWIVGLVRMHASVDVVAYV